MKIKNKFYFYQNKLRFIESKISNQGRKKKEETL